MAAAIAVVAIAIAITATPDFEWKPLTEWAKLPLSRHRWADSDPVCRDGPLSPSVSFLFEMKGGPGVPCGRRGTRKHPRRALRPATSTIEETNRRFIRRRGLGCPPVLEKLVSLP